MKKFFAIIGATLAASSLLAVTPTPQPLRDDNGLFKAKWTVFQLSIFPEKHCQLFPAATKVYGIGIGATLLENEQGVCSIGVTSCLNKNYGLQCAVAAVDTENFGLCIAPLAAFADRNSGVQIGIANVEGDGEQKTKEEGPAGWQIGFLNVGAGYQIGVINYNPQGYWFPLTLIFNFPRR